MKFVRAAAVLGLLAAAVLPEWRRYQGDRLLWRMHAVSDALLADADPPAAARRALAGMSRSAAEAAAALPGDPRPWMIASEARFEARDFPGALADLRRASASGERADVDFEMGRAFVLEKEFAAAQQSLVRAAWISPAVLAPLPEAARASLEDEVARLEGELRRGRLNAPPPRPR